MITKVGIGNSHELQKTVQLIIIAVAIAILYNLLEHNNHFRTSTICTAQPLQPPQPPDIQHNAWDKVATNIKTSKITGQPV